MTFTVPHFGSGRLAVYERLRVCFAAWRKLSIAWRLYWIERRIDQLLTVPMDLPLAKRRRARMRACKLLGTSVAAARARVRAERKASPERFYRAFEWTPGDDLAGHPHFHFWMLCPWIDENWLREAWGKALRAVGAPIDVDPIVNLKMIRTRPADIIREVHKRRDAIRLADMGQSAEDVRRYIDGWTIVDRDSNGGVPLENMASLYIGLEGRRTTQTSRGLLFPRELAECADCGVVGLIRWRLYTVAGAKRDEGQQPRYERAPP